MSWWSRVAIGFGGVCGAAALLAQGGRSNAYLDLFTHLAPLYLAGSLLVLGLAFFRWARSGRGWLLVLGGVAALSSLVLMAPEFSRSDPTPAVPTLGEKLKIIQFNLRNNDQWNDRIADWLADEDPDIIVLDDLGEDLRKSISKRLPRRHFVCTERCEVSLISKEMPVSSSAHMGELYGLTPATVLAHFRHGEDTFAVAGTHLARPYLRGPDSLSTYTSVQDENIRRLRRILGAYPQNSLILVGDFNSTPWSFRFRREEAQLRLDRRTRFLFTWPANRTSIAFLPIDHVYAGADWRTVSVTRGPRLGSDHYPVVAVLTRSRVH